MSICSFMLPCAPRSGKELALFLVERWSRHRGRHPVFLPLGVYGDSASRPAPRKGPIVHVARRHGPGPPFYFIVCMGTVCSSPTRPTARFLVTVNVYVLCVFTPLHCDEPIMAARQVSVLPVAPPPLVHSKSESSIDLIFSGAETMTFPKETLVRPELRIMQHNEAPAPPRFLFARELILFTR
jgi:hypothetical protein